MDRLGDVLARGVLDGDDRAGSALLRRPPRRPLGVLPLRSLELFGLRRLRRRRSGRLVLRAIDENSCPGRLSVWRRGHLDLLNGSEPLSGTTFSARPTGMAARSSGVAGSRRDSGAHVGLAAFRSSSGRSASQGADPSETSARSAGSQAKSPFWQRPPTAPGSGLG